MVRSTALLLLASAAMASAAAADAARPSTPPPPSRLAERAVYKDASAPVEARVDDLLCRMTLEEKVAQITSIWEARRALGPIPTGAALSRAYPNGLGQVTRPSDAGGPGSPRVTPGRSARATAEYVNALQRWAVERTRLGIPILFHEEGLHGLAAKGATSFPQAIALASSWDPDLVRAVNAVTARETRARGVHLSLTPVVDIARDPRWGRIEETFGEDPYLVGEMGVAAVEGLQGSGRARHLAPDKVFAILKHMTGHGQPEAGQNIGPAPLGRRELREFFLPPFEQVVRRTGISAVMASYNEVDGVPSHINRWLLGDVLRGEWGYRGAIVSDYYAIDQLQSIHHVAGSIGEAAARAIEAGVDSDLPEGVAYTTLIAAVREGRVRETAVDRAARHMLELKFRAGLFEHPYADPATAEAKTNTPAARALALEAAHRSITLLTNKGMLPLKPQDTVAVIGPNAAVARLGGYYGEPPVTVSILEGIRRKLAGRGRIVFAQGVKITEGDDWWQDEIKLADPADNRRLIAEAVETARGADRIVLAIGDTEQTSREGWDPKHLGDRSSLDLVGQQQELFDALKALGKPIAVVLINGRPASTVAIAEQADALVEGWYLGEQGGTAMADVLFGDVNPGGKLPVTIPRNAGQIPSYYNVKPSAHRGYLFDTTAPLFPFGHGLSYTTFAIGAPRLSAASIGRAGRVTVSVDVANTGTRSGDETVQLYVRDDVSSVTRPIKELKGFRRVTLGVGERRTVTFELGSEALQLWDRDMRRVVEPGTFTIMAGPNSVDLKSVTLTVTP